MVNQTRIFPGYGWIYFLAIALTLSGCQLLGRDSATAVPPTPLTPTPQPVCTPPPCTSDEVYHCPGSCPGGCGTVCATPTPGALSLTAPAEWHLLAEWLTAVWQANTNPAAVRAALREAGWQNRFSDWMAADFDGDLRDEWILLLYQPDLEPDSPHNLWLVNQDGVIYQFYDEPNLAAGFSLQLKLTGLEDLTGDGLPELIFNEESCGAHTCFSGYRVLSGPDGTIGNLVSRPELNDLPESGAISMSYADTHFVDFTQDGLLDFIVHGGQIGSAGAGIVRTYTEVWAWDGTAVTLADTILDYTQYRHHILYEANDYMAAGNLEPALLLYEQAINDASLIESPFADNDEETYAAISQFAAFRLILVDLILGHNDNARRRLDWLTATYPGTPTTDAAVLLIKNWTDGSGMNAACDAVELSMQSYTNPTGVLLDQGYGNPSLTAADFCP